MSTPPCFPDDESFARYKQLTIESGAETGQFFFCRDCTHPYFREQVRLGRCVLPRVAFRTRGTLDTA